MTKEDAIEIQEFVSKTIKEEFMRSNFATIKGATVIVGGINMANITILLAGDSTNITDIQNKTGITLVANDLVDVILKNNDYSNMFIAWKR